MEVLYFFIGLLVVGLLTEKIEILIKKYKIEENYPFFATIKNIFNIIILIVIFSVLVISSWVGLFKDGIENYQHLYILFVSAFLLYMFIIFVKKKIKK